MIRDLLQHAGETTFQQIALIISVLLFAALLVWTFTGRKNRFDHASRLPLEDDAAANSSGDIHSSASQGNTHG